MNWKTIRNWFTLQVFAFILIFLGVFLLAFILIAYGLAGYLFKWNIDPNASAQFGDFVGGVVGAIWALAGVILFYQTLKLQQVEIKEQKDAIKRQEIELKAQRAEAMNARAYNMVYNQLRLIDAVVNDLVWWSTPSLEGEERKLEGIYAVKRWHHSMKNSNQKVSGIYTDYSSQIDQLFRILTNSVNLLMRLKEQRNMSPKDIRDVFEVFKYNVDERIWQFVFILNGKKECFNSEMKRHLEPKIKRIMEYNEELNHLNEVLSKSEQ